jgi:hypothetical protein|tara:strand:+ start:3966 stop:4658 length:693 start_codon:yes stop_codon:yes gene_type:complete
VKKKFSKIYETYLNRYTRGGFLTGDLVRLKDGFENTEAFKSLGANVQQMLKQFADSDMNIRVSGIENKYPSHQPGNTDNSNGQVSVTVSQETAPGRYDGFVTADPELFDTVDVYPNRMPVPNSFVRPNGTEFNFDSNPAEYDDEYIGQDPLKSQIGTGTELKAPEQGDDKELHNKEVKIDQFGANNKWDLQSPGGGNAQKQFDTSVYMKGGKPIEGPSSMTGALGTTAIG